MSRVGKKPIPIPEKTKINYKDGILRVEGQKGALTRALHPDMDLDIQQNVIHIIPKKNDRKTIAVQGLTRSLVANMVTGVSQGFQRSLEINGIGYRAELKGNHIVFNLGYSHPIQFDIPKDISVTVEKNNVVTLSGIDKEAMGHMAAAIRGLRPPEPYKGKGVKYSEEYIQRKAGKSGGK